MLFSHDRDRLIELLTPIKNKMRIKWLLVALAKHGTVMLSAAIIFLVFSRFYPVFNYKQISLSMIAVSLISALLYVMFKQPDYLRAAREADKIGLNERITTALHFYQDKSRIAVRQKEDAIRLLEKKLPVVLSNIKLVSFSRKQLVFSIGLAGLFLMLFFLPNPMDPILAEKKLEIEKLKEVSEQMEKEKEAIQENKELSQQQKEALVKQLDQLNKKSIKEQIKELEKVTKELANIKNQEVGKQEAIQKMIEMLSKNQHTKAIAQALNEQDGAQLKQLLQRVQEHFEQLSEKEQNEIIATMQKAANHLEQEAEKWNSEPLLNIAKKLQQANRHLPNQASFALLSNGLTQLIQQNMQSAENTSQLTSTISTLQQAQISLQPSLVASNRNPAAESQNSHNQNETNQGQQTNTQNNNQGTPSNDGQSGNGNGSSNGSSGNGNGNGTGDGNIGNGAGMGEGSHQIRVPSERIHSEGTTDTINGPLGEGESEERMSGQQAFSPSINLPYEAVFGEYQQIAGQRLDTGEIPMDYQEVVKDYFSLIEP